MGVIQAVTKENYPEAVAQAAVQEQTAYPISFHKPVQSRAGRWAGRKLLRQNLSDTLYVAQQQEPNGPAVKIAAGIAAGLALMPAVATYAHADDVSVQLVGEYKLRSWLDEHSDEWTLRPRIMTPVGLFELMYSNRSGEKRMVSALENPFGRMADATQFFEGSKDAYRIRWYGAYDLGSFHAAWLLGHIIESKAEVGIEGLPGFATEDLDADLAAFRIIGSEGLFNNAGIERLKLYYEHLIQKAMFNTVDQDKTENTVNIDVFAALPMVGPFQLSGRFSSEERRTAFAYGNFRVPTLPLVLFDNTTEGTVNKAGFTARVWDAEKRSYIGVGPVFLLGGSDVPGRYQAIPMEADGDPLLGLVAEGFVDRGSIKLGFDLGYERMAGENTFRRTIPLTQVLPGIGPVPFNDAQEFTQGEKSSNAYLNFLLAHGKGDQGYNLWSFGLSQRETDSDGSIVQTLTPAVPLPIPPIVISSAGDGEHRREIGVVVAYTRMLGNISETGRLELDRVSRQKFQVSLEGVFDRKTHDVSAFAGLTFGF